MRFITLIIAALVAATAPADSAFAQPSKAELRAQFKAREGQLRELKKTGRVGETLDGYVDFVETAGPADTGTRSLVDDENKDRRALYAILAAEINTEHPDAKVKATPETVAVRNARRNIERAGPDEFLRVSKHRWIRIRDFPRFERITKLKAQGKVGETEEGLVEAVRPDDGANSAFAKDIQDENAARTAEYRAIAQKDRAEPDAVARRMGRLNIEAARVGEMVKEGGRWRKK